MNSPSKVYIEFTNKALNVCGGIILNWYSIYFYVQFCCGKIGEACRVADWCIEKGKPGEVIETETYKVEIKKY